MIESFNCVLHDKVLLLNCNSPKVMTPDSETEEKKSEILTEEYHDPSSSKAIHHEFLFGSCGKKELQRDETLKGISRKHKHGPSQNYPNIKRTVQLSAAKERPPANEMIATGLFPATQVDELLKLETLALNNNSKHVNKI